MDRFLVGVGGRSGGGGSVNSSAEYVRLRSCNPPSPQPPAFSAPASPLLHAAPSPYSHCQRLAWGGSAGDCLPLGAMTWRVRIGPGRQRRGPDWMRFGADRVRPEGPALTRTFLPTSSTVRRSPFCHSPGNSTVAQCEVLVLATTA